MFPHEQLPDMLCEAMSSLLATTRDSNAESICPMISVSIAEEETYVWLVNLCIAPYDIAGSIKLETQLR